MTMLWWMKKEEEILSSATISDIFNEGNAPGLKLFLIQYLNWPLTKGTSIEKYKNKCTW